MWCVISRPSKVAVSLQKPEILHKIELYCSDAGSVAGYPYPISRVTIEFSPYTQFKLHPIKDVELPDARDGMSCDYADVATYQMAINHDWRMREGGILFAIGEYGDFFNTMTHYHSGPKGTLMEDWNTLFEKLQNSEYRKNLIPCMVSTSTLFCPYIL